MVENEQMVDWLGLFMHIPAESSFLHAYQTLIAALIAVGAALIAYNGARYRANADARRKRELVLSYCKTLAHKMPIDWHFYESQEESEYFNNLILLCELIRAYDTEIFNADFLQCLETDEQIQAFQIKNDLLTLKVRTEGIEELAEATYDGTHEGEMKERWIKNLHKRGELLVGKMKQIEKRARRLKEKPTKQKDFFYFSPPPQK